MKTHLARGVGTYCGTCSENETVWIDDVTCKNCLRRIEADLKRAKSKVN